MLFEKLAQHVLRCGIGVIPDIFLACGNQCQPFGKEGRIRSQQFCGLRPVRFAMLDIAIYLEQFFPAGVAENSALVDGCLLDFVSVLLISGRKYRRFFCSASTDR
jgi:hypothetical protein